MLAPRTGLAYLSAAIALVGAAIHIAAIAGGPSWFAFFGAPPSIVESARQGTWPAPVSAMVIAALMTLCAAYALSALGLVRRLPLLRLGLFSIAVICLLRAMLIIPVGLKHPELLKNTFEVVASIIWALAGVGFAAAFWLLWLQPTPMPNHSVKGTSRKRAAPYLER